MSGIIYKALIFLLEIGKNSYFSNREKSLRVGFGNIYILKKKHRGIFTVKLIAWYDLGVYY